MDSKLLDLIYENKEVSGVALAYYNGEVKENQLLIPDPSVEKVAKRFGELRASLSGSQRNLKGFSVRTPDGIFQVSFFESFMVLVSLYEGCESAANKVDNSIHSIMNENAFPPHTKGVTTAAVEGALHTSEGLGPEAIVADDGSSVLPGNSILLTKHCYQLVALISSRAPKEDAVELVTESVQDLNLEDVVTITASEAISIGNKAISKMSNSKERKFVSIEFDIIARWIGL